MSYSNLKILMPDTIHFHERNFKSLFDFIERHKVNVTKNSEVNSWAGLYGDYSSKLNEIQPYLKKLKNLSSDELFLFRYASQTIWKVARAELLSYFLPKVEFNVYIKHRDDKSHLDLMLNLDRAVVLNCYAASMYFMDYWKAKLASIPVQKYALIFSGSQIYNKSLLEVLKHSQTTPVVMEHFFTGNEYYFEDRYTPIANASDLKYLVHHKVKDEESNDYDRRRLKAINKILLSNNRNVKKTGEFLHLDFPEGKTVALIGQVVNDYSVIETATEYLNSVEFYKEFIIKAIDSGLNVVFKTHPWERHKNNVRTSFTKDMIEFWVNNDLTNKQKSKLVITETADIDSIFKQVDFVAGLCSQGLLESVFDGFKPLQFGNAFYGGRGFTSDYVCVDDFLSDLNSEHVSGYLTLGEYKEYESFLVSAFERELVSVHKSGILVLESKLKEYPLIPLVEKKLDVPSKEAHNVVQELSISKVDNTSSTVRKLRKLKKDPKAFFKDSQYSFLRAISKVTE
ncbi:MAG: hypothetical protein JXR16_13775 [Bermanella sp.]